MRAALDTNVLGYVEGVNGEVLWQSAAALLQNLAPGAALVPVQALGELYNVLVRKSGWAGDQARRAILTWRDAFPLVPTTETAIIAAADLAADHKLGIWDSLIVATAAEGSCRLLLPEDRRPAGRVLVARRNRRQPLRRETSSAPRCPAGRARSGPIMNSAEIPERLATEPGLRPVMAQMFPLRFYRDMRLRNVGICFLDEEKAMRVRTELSREGTRFWSSCRAKP